MQAEVCCQKLHQLVTSTRRVVQIHRHHPWTAALPGRERVAQYGRLARAGLSEQQCDGAPRGDAVFHVAQRLRVARRQQQEARI